MLWRGGSPGHGKMREREEEREGGMSAQGTALGEHLRKPTDWETRGADSLEFLQPVGRLED